MREKHIHVNTIDVYLGEEERKVRGHLSVTKTFSENVNIFHFSVESLSFPEGGQVVTIDNSDMDIYFLSCKIRAAFKIRYAVVIDGKATLYV